MSKTINYHLRWPPNITKGLEAKMTYDELNFYWSEAYIIKLIRYLVKYFPIGRVQSFIYSLLADEINKNEIIIHLMNKAFKTDGNGSTNISK